MKIKRLFINNYKSLVNFELVEPNAFSVFVGPNAAGKSNVFEALEFLSYNIQSSLFASELFGTPSSYLNKQAASKEQPNYGHRLTGYPLTLHIELDDQTIIERNNYCIKKENGWSEEYTSPVPVIKIASEDEAIKASQAQEGSENNFSKSFSRLFVGNERVNKLNINGQEKLRIDGRNLESVLFRVFKNEIKREEITEWMESLIPEFEKIEVVKSELSSGYHLRIFEKHLPDPIGKNLISDGTYNILAFLTAVYQSDEPQFLCIEELENGLNPYVVRTLVEFFRTLCKEKGHYIWLNTHSATLVRALHPHEIILVDKVDGVTRARQVNKDFNLHGLATDDAWLSNAFGGGLPW